MANIFVFLLMWESSGLTTNALAGFPEEVLVAYGAKLNFRIAGPNYEWWRFIAPMFIHVNLIHLLVNMYSLLMVGPFVEKLYGSAKFVVFWILTGIGGVVASYLTVRPQLATNAFARFIFKAEDVPSAGASGALFGLVGVLFVFGIKFRRELPEGFKRAFGTGMLPIIFINLFIGFLGRGFIDNAAHLGGLLSGAALAVAVDYQRPGVRRAITGAWRVMQILALALVLVGFYEVARNFNRPALQAARAAPNPNTLIFLNYVNAMNQVQETVAAIIHKNDQSGVNEVIAHAQEAPAPDARAVELRDQLLAIFKQILRASPPPDHEPGRPPPLDQKLVNQFYEWRKTYDEWLKRAAKTYNATQ